MRADAPGAAAALLLRDRDVRRFVSSRVFAGVSMTLLRAAIAWQVFALTGSAFHLGLIGLVQFVPVLPLSLVAGAVADSTDRRRVVALAQAVSLAVSLGLAAASRGGEAPLALVYGGVFWLAIAHAFEAPAATAILPGLVARERFPTAVALLATFRNLAWVAGPVVAGFAIDAAGIAPAYAMSAALIAGSLFALAGVRGPRDGAARGVVSLAAIREGVFFVRSRPAVLGAMTLDMFAVIFASVTALLPIYAGEILAVGPRGYGMLAAALEIGTLLMAVALLLLPPIERAGRALLVAVAGFGLATIAFGLSRSFALSVAALVLAGMADQVSMVARSAIVQLSTPDALRGRVSSVNMIFISASNQLGAVESGFLAALTSATFSVVFGGFACLAVLAAVTLRVPQLRAYRTGAEE